MTRPRPNVVFVFADQLRADALGYAGDPNVATPHLDALAGESINLVNAFASAPVCTPYRATLMTGQHPVTHGLFLNDLPLRPKLTPLAEVFRQAGYVTGYIGKWHIDGHGRYGWIPPERRLGFVDHWKTLECTHRYNDSFYYEGDSPEIKVWQGYDALAQTDDAVDFIKRQSADRPFLLVLSWGPPHDPLETAPPEFKALYHPDQIEVRPNVPAERAPKARENLAGYYAHISALDEGVGRLRRALRETGLEQNTLFIFTSDHGDMLHSQGQTMKQRPWDESLRVPFLLRCPALFGEGALTVGSVVDSVDIMPTLLGLCGLPIPHGVEGLDRSTVVRGDAEDDHAALINCVVPFGQWTRAQGGREIRGLRTRRHTYVRDLKGPWLLYDNAADPYQMTNLCGKPEAATAQAALDAELNRRLAAIGDEFLPAEHYIEKWGYAVDPVSLTVPIRHWPG